MASEFDLEVIERVSALEVNQDILKEEQIDHKAQIKDIREKLTILVVEVRQIRNALYVLAGAVAMNVPALAGILEKIKLILF